MLGHVLFGNIIVAALIVLLVLVCFGKDSIPYQYYKAGVGWRVGWARRENFPRLFWMMITWALVIATVMVLYTLKKAHRG